MKQTLRVVAFLSLTCAAGVARAQRVDVAVGAGSMYAAPASQAGTNHSQQSLSGGFYPVASADLMFRKHFGVQGEAAWKGSRGIYTANGLNQPFRPFFADLNGVWVSRLFWRTDAELMGGAGAQITRFYKGTEACGILSGCVPYVSSNHLMGHFGGGLRFYPTRHNFFIRPEGHLYVVRNNVEFSSGRAVRYGVSIGYSFGR